jgi:hypothetical protein
MREDVQNEHALGPVIDPGDQPVFIAMNVKHRPSAYDIGMREITSYLSQRIPVRSLSDPIPVHQRDQRIVVPLRELKNGWLADHPHNPSLQNVNIWVKHHEPDQPVLERLRHSKAAPNGTMARGFCQAAGLAIEYGNGRTGRCPWNEP